MVAPTYGWADVQADLEDGVHPEVVCARLGEPIAYLLEVASQQGWAITWDGTPTKAKWSQELDA